MKKYELIKQKNSNFFRIKALRDFGNVKTGEVGGLIEKEENLSQDGDYCWIYGNARVSGTIVSVDKEVILNESSKLNSHYNSICKVCGSPAYLGFSSLECSNKECGN